MDYFHPFPPLHLWQLAVCSLYLSALGFFICFVWERGLNSTWMRSRVCLFLWLISLSIMPSRSILIVSSDRIPSFLCVCMCSVMSDSVPFYDWTIFLCGCVLGHVYTAFSFICSFVGGYLVCFYTLPLLQQTWEYRYLLRIVVWINAQECNCWVMWLSYFYFLKHLYTVFHSGCLNLCLHSVCVGSLFSHSHQHTFLVFLVIGFLTGV